MEFFKKTNIDFIGLRWYPIGVSIAIMALSAFAIATKGFNYSIEFTGGALVQVSFDKPVAMDQVRKALDEEKLHPEIQSLGGSSTYILREKGTETAVENLSSRLIGALQKGLPGTKITLDRREFIGPVVGAHLRKQTLMAIALSLLGIVCYVAFRFNNPIWGIAGVLSLFHDVLGTAGFISLSGKELDLLIVSALLTIAGYSINDSIVIFDRMREMQRHIKKEPLAQTINSAINDTLSRTIITVLTVQMVCVVLWLFGGDVLRNFGLAMVVGNILGSYSSISVAAPLVYEYELRQGVIR